MGIGERREKGTDLYKTNFRKAEWRILKCCLCKLSYQNHRKCPTHLRKDKLELTMMKGAVYTAASVISIESPKVRNSFSTVRIDGLA